MFTLDPYCSLVNTSLRRSRSFFPEGCSEAAVRGSVCLSRERSEKQGDADAVPLGVGVRVKKEVVCKAMLFNACVCGKL